MLLLVRFTMVRSIDCGSYFSFCLCVLVVAVVAVVAAAVLLDTVVGS